MEEGLKAITTVYSYYFPEVRQAISELTRNYPHEVFLQSIKPGLDDFHVPVIDSYIDSCAGVVPDLKGFSFRYPTAGAEEGIREVLTLLQQKGVKTIYVLKGDYEGYKSVAETRCITTREIGPEIDPVDLEPGYWFLSNPSARNGNVIVNGFIERICEAGHKVFYDLTYLGLTERYVFDVSHPNVFAATVSFSKPYGLFYYRVGFTFSREEVPSLYGNKWFKNIYALLIAERLIREKTIEEIFRKYKPIQKKIIESINREYGLGIKPSDALLLGYLPVAETEKLTPDQLEMISRFRRGDFYRFCLTPYFEELEKV